MNDNKLPTPCGLNCSECTNYLKSCNGCSSIQGKPFWVQSMNAAVCPLYDCAVNTKKLAHCGFCPTFPCTTFLEMEQSDPAMTLEKAKASAHKRKMELIRRKQSGK